MYGSTTLQPVTQNGLPVATAVYNEASACFVQASYFDTEGNPLTPSAVWYRVDDVTSGEPIVPWTVLTPAATNLITVSSAQNAMISVTRAFEVHQVTLQVTDSSNDVFFPEVRFEIRRIFGPVPGNQDSYTADSDVT